MEKLLADKIAIVTGGARGIGEAVVRKFSEEGAAVSFIDINKILGVSLSQELNELGYNTFFFHGDLMKSSTVVDFIERTINQFNKIDILVNNAGVNDFIGLEDDPNKFITSLEKNLFHYFYTAHYALPYLIQSKGVIVNISSKVALMGEGHTSGYAAAKGGILALTKEWALDLAKYGIRVNSVIPAQVWTPLAEEAVTKNPQGQALKNYLESKIPLGKRFTNVQEVANTVLYLASALSQHTTGSELHPNGGYFLDNRFLNKNFAE